GYRAIAFCGDTFRLQGKRLNDITGSYPELAGLGEDRVAKGNVLDGELVIFDEDGIPDFQLMQIRRERNLKASFLVFDLLWSDGTDLRSRPYSERRERLEDLGLAGERWSVPDRLEGELAQVLAATADVGLEGVVAKLPDSPYVSGTRTRYWLKVKNQRRQEFVVGGWLPGKGHRSGTLGSLLLGYNDDDRGLLRFAGRAGTGMDDRLLGQITAELAGSRRDESPFRPGDLADVPRNAIWCEPRMVVEVRFTQWTRDGRLRNPVFVGIRRDKVPEEVVREER
ncbi:MAG: non-homologous end-joining DNA ligase, partial [Actinomycetota bacterium]|nr:non-homologous end-joining DNA ligase [Actinomycetota bacterium]